MYLVANKAESVVRFKSKNINFCFKSIQVNMIFLLVKQNESLFVIRKISRNNHVENNLKIKFYKSVLTEKLYAADFLFFSILFLKVAFLSFFIQLFLVLFSWIVIEIYCC